jgi:preprotein translocase subunit SecD
MSKFKRFLLVLAVLATAGAFLLPTIRWYFIIPQDQRTLALGSRVQIQRYAQKMAISDMDELKGMASGDGGKALPERLAFVKGLARKAYKANGRKAPAAWDAVAALGAWSSERAALGAIESHYRERILGIKKVHSDAIQLGLDLSGGISFNIQANLTKRGGPDAAPMTASEREDAMSRGLEILKSRIDRFGLTEPEIRRMGEDQIYVEIPGAADPERINGIIMGKGKLAFHLIDQDATASVTNFLSANPSYLVEDDGRIVDKDGKRVDSGLLPEGEILSKEALKDAYGLDVDTGRYYVLKTDENSMLDGNYIQDATVSSDSITGVPAVAFQLNKEGADKFSQLTSTNIGKPMSIVLDDKVKSVANIQSAISDRGQITGLDQEEAQNVAKILKTAALPVELESKSYQAIGASLGEDAIKQGLNALIYGLGAVLVFMFLYYRGAGINAMMAQVLNMFIMLGILSALNLTLILPSIAGFVLTIGMAVDANVIVFERIKEELRLGKGRKASVDAGFNKAFSAVFDGNLTTIIAAFFLAILGSGPIQGFAVSLAIGNITSLFTSLFVSRLIFDVGTDVFKSKKVSISWRIKQ